MLILLSGVTGAGKDTVKKELINRLDNITTMPSYTDREPRPGEVHGEIYNFITTEEFEEKIRQEEFYEYSKHYGHYYGTSKKILNDKIQSGKIIVKDIDVNGTENLIKLLKNDVKLVTIFLKVPREELIERLLQRGDDEEKIHSRLTRFEYEESKMDMYDYVVENKVLEETIQKVINIVEKEM